MMALELMLWMVGILNDLLLYNLDGCCARVPCVFGMEEEGSLC